MTEPFFPIVADYDRGFFCVEGPMVDDRPWQSAARRAREKQRRVVCGPAGTDRVALAAEYVGVDRMTGVPPGSVVNASNLD
jgi:hypothetical protein